LLYLLVQLIEYFFSIVFIIVYYAYKCLQLQRCQSLMKLRIVARDDAGNRTTLRKTFIVR
ncbi:MAG: hypothetical protein ACEQSX_13160, partial [Baekduiaceae bacterium]